MKLNLTPYEWRLLSSSDRDVNADPDALAVAAALNEGIGAALDEVTRAVMQDRADTDRWYDLTAFGWVPKSPAHEQEANTAREALQRSIILNFYDAWRTVLASLPNDCGASDSEARAPVVRLFEIALGGGYDSFVIPDGVYWTAVRYKEEAGLDPFAETR